MGASGVTVIEPKLNGAVAEELVAAAEDAGLRYVSDECPGYRRKAKSKNFEYFDAEGKRIRDGQRLLRIKRLAIPPAWTDLWICPSPNGHIQATGRDARGRKQYRYHERWREVRDENKFDRLAQFAKALPNIRRRIEQDLKLSGLPQRKVLATIVRLLERTFIRIGNEEYAREQVIRFNYAEESSCEGQRRAGPVSVSRQERASTRDGCY
jgi:DNA topoisomerase-1